MRASGGLVLSRTISVSTDSRDIESHAFRLVQRLGDLDPFRSNPEAAITSSFGLIVEYRIDIDGNCDIDGSYHPERRTIRIAKAASPGRRRFTALHELAHALGRSDSAFQDWLFKFDDAGRVQEERVANAFASAVLLPELIVNEYIPDIGPCAWDVVQLATASTASREAVCVRASQRLRGPGMVALMRDSVMLFSASRALPYRVTRNTDQGPGSFFARASEYGRLRETGVRIRFADGKVTSDTLMADAYADDKGYLFVVLMEHSAPWQVLTPSSLGPDGFEIECEECDALRITWARECPICGDHPCPDHGCSCRRQVSRRGSIRRCRNCNIQLPTAARPEVEYCDNCA